MSSDNQVCQKRKVEIETECSTVPDVKRTKCEIQFNILHFSDCVLVKILYYLDCTSLYQLGKTCTRFSQLVEDPAFWVYVDGRTPPNDIEKSQFIFDNIGNQTKHLLLAGKKRSDRITSLFAIVEKNFLKNITVLALENQFLDGRVIKLRNFPNTLEELSFRRSFISDYRRFFNTSSDAMKKLRVLVLDHCQWVETDMVLSLSKFPSLEILSLYMCKKVGDHNIVYLSIIGRFGFKSLKVFDARFTGLGNESINSFYRSTSLQEIYFQSYCTTYRDERAIRKAELKKRASRMSRRNIITFESDDDDNDDSSATNVRNRFGGGNLSIFKMDTLNDTSVCLYSRMRSLKKNETLDRPKSVLYQYPYLDECKCGFYENFWKHKGDSSPEHPSTSSPPPRCKLKSFFHSTGTLNDRSKNSIYLLQIDPIAYNRFRKNVENHTPLPHYLQKESNPRTKDRRWIGLRDPLNDYEIAMIEHTSYQLDSYSMTNHILNINSIDFTDPLSVLNSLSPDTSRRRIHVVHGNMTLAYRNPYEKVFTVDPNDEVLSFCTELLVNCARLVYLVHDEIHAEKVRSIISVSILTVCNDNTDDETLLLRREVKELSRNISSATRRVLRAFMVGMTVLKKIDSGFQNAICFLVQQTTDKVTYDCQTMIRSRLRDKCDTMRSIVPYEHGIYMNEIPEEYSDDFWGFKVVDDEIVFVNEMTKCKCKKECQTCLETEIIEIRDGRPKDAIKELAPSEKFVCKTATSTRSKDSSSSNSLDFLSFDWYQNPVSHCSNQSPVEDPLIYYSEGPITNRIAVDAEDPVLEEDDLNEERPVLVAQIECRMEHIQNREEADCRAQIPNQNRESRNDQNLNSNVVSAQNLNRLVPNEPNPNREENQNRLRVRARDPQEVENVNPSIEIVIYRAGNEQNQDMENQLNGIFRGIDDVNDPLNDREHVDVRFHLNPAMEANIRLANRNDDHRFDQNRYQDIGIQIVRNQSLPGIPLRRLSLRGFPNISDSSLQYLDHLELDLLDVTKTQVSSEAVKSYVLLHPNCRVIHETACICKPSLHF